MKLQAIAGKKAICMLQELLFIGGKNHVFQEQMVLEQFSFQAVTWDVSFARTERSAEDRWENILLQTALWISFSN